MNRKYFQIHAAFAPKVPAKRQKIICEKLLISFRESLQAHFICQIRCHEHLSRHFRIDDFTLRRGERRDAKVFDRGVEALDPMRSVVLKDEIPFKHRRQSDHSRAEGHRRKASSLSRGPASRISCREDGNSFDEDVVEARTIQSARGFI
jgi:hypothetical protein